MGNNKVIAVFVGIRSQYMKLAALQKFTLNSQSVDWIYINTGQHYDHYLAKQYLDEYKIKIDYNLRCGDPNLKPVETFGKMITECENLLVKLNPDAVVVFGDANSTLATALAAKRLKLKLIHVEAGVRTGTNSPEELNRVITDKISDFHLASTKSDFGRLIEEGYSESAFFAGDLIRDLAADISTQTPVSSPFALVSIHREENTKDLNTIVQIVSDLAEVELYAHLIAHPRVMKMIEIKYGTAQPWSHIVVKPSIAHKDLLQTIANSEVIITDSGALQREGFYLGTRSVVVQEVAFWPSLTSSGFNVLSPPGVSHVACIEMARTTCDIELDDFGSVPVARKVASIINSVTV